MPALRSARPLAENNQVHAPARASIIALVFTGAALQVFPSHAAPQEIPIAVTGVSDGLNAREIQDYPTAIDAIVRVLVKDLNLPVPLHTLQLHSSLDEFEAGLIKHLGLKPDLARATAAFAKAAVGGRVVLVFAPRLADLSWPDRIELLAHEFAHTVQLELAGHRSLIRQQWLTEGFAEWAGYAVTDRLGLDEMSKARARIIAKLRAQPVGTSLPRLAEMNSFAQWIAARTKHGYDATFSQSFLAVELLMQRHSFERVMSYFRLFRESRNYPQNFRSAFGESIEDFQDVLDRHLEQLLK